MREMLGAVVQTYDLVILDTPPVLSVVDTLELLPEVDAALVWTPGQREPEAIIADDSEPSAIAATFVGFAPASTAHDELRFMEDGYVALLAPASTSALAQALRSGSPFELRDPASARSLHVTIGG